jgi:putative DNA primase/helicase
VHRKESSAYDFPETHKLWIDGNHKPALSGGDQAIWNRVHLIPFNVKIPDSEIDQELPVKLMAEAEGSCAVRARV